jgi:protein-tyrosine phosphatase
MFRARPRIGVLFVCANNICRSPMAAAVFQLKAARAGLTRHVRISSAGTRGDCVGQDVDPRARAAARRRGYTIPAHSARQATAADFARFDWIVAMDRSTLAALAALNPPGFAGQLVLCRELAANDDLDEVPDPYFGPPTGFDDVLDLLEGPAQALVDAIARSLGPTAER